uniref:Uncharacterized protein n=1 Tax=Anguilla anguilla TaxID=7936 RepID=A0A0E9T2P1_ANGAN
MQQHGYLSPFVQKSQAYVGIKTGDLQHVMMWGSTPQHHGAFLIGPTEFTHSN